MSEGNRDIIERLRDRDSIVLSGLFHAIPTMQEAADEIETLRRQLLIARSALRQVSMAADQAVSAVLSSDPDLGRYKGIAQKGG